MEETVLPLEQPSGSSPKELRDKAMLELLYATGMRVSELITVKLSDVNLILNYVVCRDGEKERVIPFWATMPRQHWIIIFSMAACIWCGKMAVSSFL